MYLIRNWVLHKLVTDKKHKPLAFKRLEEAKWWMHRNGDPEYLKIINHDVLLHTDEMKQLLKVYFQQEGWE